MYEYKRDRRGQGEEGRDESGPGFKVEVSDDNVNHKRGPETSDEYRGVVPEKGRCAGDNKCDRGDPVTRSRRSEVYVRL